MQETVNKMRRRGDTDRGFTMIELLVVVVIIGVLVAIAVPVYLNYRKGAANKSAESDVRGAISAIEQFYTDNSNVYPADQSAGPGVALSWTTPGVLKIPVSPNNSMAFDNVGTTNQSYTICAVNSDGGIYYGYNSANGGSVHAVTATTLATCLAAA
jgi:type IV pilus assembly protein PilA